MISWKMLHLNLIIVLFVMEKTFMQILIICNISNLNIKMRKMNFYYLKWILNIIYQMTMRWFHNNQHFYNMLMIRMFHFHPSKIPKRSLTKKVERSPCTFCINSHMWDKWLNNANPWILMTYKCNHDLKFIVLFSKYSKFLIYYIT